MDPTNRQGGDPNRRAAYDYDNPEQRQDGLPSSSTQPWPANLRGPNYYNPEQRHDYPSSSSSRRPPRLQDACPLIVYPNYNQMNQTSTDVVGGIPPDGNIWANHHAPLARPPMQNVIGGQAQYQRHSGSAAVFPATGYNPVVNPPGAAVYAQQGGSGTVFSNLNPYAAAYQPQAQLCAQAQPGDATDFSACGGNANNNSNSYASAAGLIPPPANANQAAVPNQTTPPADLNAFANDLWSAVTSATTPRELVGIVNFVINTEFPLFEVAQHDLGQPALMELVNNLVVLNVHPGVLQRLFRSLIEGWIMEQNGPNLLQHFFTTLGYARCSIFIDELAVPRFWEMVRSSSEYMSIMMCLDAAQRTRLHDMIVDNTAEVGKCLFGSILLQTVLKGDNNELKERIRERVEQHLVDLSMDLYGNRMVQECFVPKRKIPDSPVLLQRGLNAFLRLPGEDLQALVQNHSARYVLRRLLGDSLYMQRPVPCAEALQLAERILTVGAAGDKEDMETLNHLAFQVIDRRKQ